MHVARQFAQGRRSTDYEKPFTDHPLSAASKTWIHFNSKNFYTHLLIRNMREKFLWNWSLLSKKYEWLNLALVLSYFKFKPKPYSRPKNHSGKLQFRKEAEKCVRPFFAETTRFFLLALGFFFYVWSKNQWTQGRRRYLGIPLVQFQMAPNFEFKHRAKMDTT